MKSPARRFTLVMLAMSLLLVGGAVLLNCLIDPYNRFGNNRLGVYISAEREAKSTEVRRYPHNALIVGNSRMAMISPGALKGFRFFNGAFAGGTAEEVHWFVHHHARTQELVVLGIDLGMKDPVPTKGDTFGARSWSSTVENLVSLQTLEFSFKTMTSHWRGEPSHCLPDGLFGTDGWVKWANREDSASGRAQLEVMKRQWAGFVPATREQLSFYRRIAETLRERGIPCVVVVPPLHGEVIAHVGEARFRTLCRPWIEEVKALFPHVLDLSASAYSSPSNFYQGDPFHFKPEVGGAFMNEVVLPYATKLLAGQGK